MFKGLNNYEMNVVLDAMEERNFKQGETVISQGDKGDLLYVVE